MYFVVLGKIVDERGVITAVPMKQRNLPQSAWIPSMNDPRHDWKLGGAFDSRYESQQSAGSIGYVGASHGATAHARD